jgi:putative transcriptional regulator
MEDSSPEAQPRERPLLPWVIVLAALVLAAGAGLLFYFTRPARGVHAAVAGQFSDLPPLTRSYLRDLAPGRFLVAARQLNDPNFAESVVLLAMYDKESALGIIVNRPLRLSVSRLLRDVKGASDRQEPVYAGGPVQRTGAVALLRSSSEPDSAVRILADIYLVTGAAQLEKSIASGEDSSRLRIYLGYAGWGAGQLDREVALGSWHVFKADPEEVFDSRPLDLWDRLIRRTNLELASR